MNEIMNQANARKARLQRFAEAAARLQSKNAIATPASMLSQRPAKAPAARVRRDYETACSQPVYVPITWRILRAVSDEFDMPVSEFTGDKRDPKFTLARYVAIGLFLQLTNMSLPAIGRRLGNRDHTTILNGRNRFDALMQGEAFRNRFEQIKSEIGA